MKFLGKLMKVVAVLGAVCCVVAYWDKIVEAAAGLKAKCRKSGDCCHTTELDDYADWDE